MKTLVTGATGFIGSYLVDRLVAEGRDVRCLVRHSSDTIALQKLGVELVYGDIMNAASIEFAVKDIDIIYHLAAKIETGYRQHFTTLLENNASPIQNLVQYSTNIKKFIFLGSMAAIGTRDSKELISEDVGCRPITPYGQSKYIAETNLLYYYHKLDFPVVVLRPPTVYGPREQHNFILTARALKHRRFAFIGDGTNYTSICYISNLIDAMLLAETKGESGSIYHIADSLPISWRYLVGIICTAMDIKSPTLYISPKVAYPLAKLIETASNVFRVEPILHPNRVATLADSFAYDISKAKRDLGYKPKVSTEEGVDSTMKWYKENYLL